MDSVHETMERIYRLFEKHGPKLAGVAAIPLSKPAEHRDYMQRLRHDPEVKERVLLLFSEGKTPTEVAREIGIPAGTIAKWSIKAGFRWPHHQRYEPHPKKAQALELLRSGMPPTQVAEKLRMSVSTVGGWSYSSGLRFVRGQRAEAAK